MGGVLQRLAQRALPRCGGVRPRIAGRFEAGAEGPGIRAEPLATPAQAVPFAPPAPARMQPVAAQPPTLANPPDAAPVFVTPKLPTPPQPISARPFVPPVMEALQSEARSAPSPEGEVRAGRATEPPGSERLARRPEAAPASIARATVPDDRPEPSAPADARIGLLLPELRAMASTFAPISGAEPQMLSGRREESAQPPDVHISIGRIEVRADRPEPRKPPRAPARPRPRLMSLEDYLGKGRGG